MNWLDRLFGIAPSQVPTVKQVDTGFPWWCMMADHAPFYRETEYNEHMKRIHGIDFEKGKMKLSDRRAWQCGNVRHPVFGDELLFTRHMKEWHRGT